VSTPLYARATPPNSPPVGDERILFHLNRGDLVVGLFDTVAPKHAAQIRKLVRLGVYDTTTIFRVEPGFVAQVTNVQNRLTPLSAAQREAIQKIPAEFSKLLHRPGMLSMARDDKSVDSAETSFSFMLGRAPELDGKYTIFGQVEWGAPLLTMIAREPRDDQNRPFNRIVIERAEIKTAAEIAQLRSSKKLRAPIPLSAMPKPAPAPRPQSR
jgi:cyclophilin family peptidyl-prolyl cis-trans isomerase